MAEIEDATEAGDGGVNDALTIAERLRSAVDNWSSCQRRLVLLAGEFAASDEWVEAGAPTAAHWLAETADVEVCTAREWIRVGRALAGLPRTAAAFAARRLSYSKVRALTRVADPTTEDDLVELASAVPAGTLNRALAAWVRQHTDSEELAELHRQRRSVTWHPEPDGMVLVRMRLAPLVAGALQSRLGNVVMRSARPVPGDASADAWPTVAQQYADAVEAVLLPPDAQATATEIIIHVRGDGASLDDGTPLAATVVERIAPTSFLRALVHDANGRPVNASIRRRHPDARQKRIVKERDRVCVDCGRADLLTYDHEPPYRDSRQTVVDELRLRCAPCHWRRHREPPAA